MSEQKRKELAAEVRSIFEKMPTNTELYYFQNEKFFGFTAQFSEKDLGFGEVSFYVNKETGEAGFDNEAMNWETCERILARSVGKVIKKEPAYD